MRGSRLLRFAWLALAVALSVSVTRATGGVSVADPLPPEPNIRGAAQDEFVARGPLHRMLVNEESPLFALLLEAQAVVSSEDYGSFRLLVVDARRVGGLSRLRTLDAQLQDELTLVDLNGYRIDGADPAGTQAMLRSIPDSLRAPGTPPADGDSRLRLVQFIGPVKDPWLDAVRATGVHVVTYVANDAYVVKADPEENARLDSLGAQPFVLGIHDYEPAFKLRPELRRIDDTQPCRVTVQVIDDAEGETFAGRLGARAFEVLAAPNRVLGYWNVQLLMDGANVLELARDPHVFAIEPIYPAVRLWDEKQGQICAGNVDAPGSTATNASYLSWLQSKGFPGQDPFPFVVDVTDDGVDRGSTSDVNVEYRVHGTPLGSSRLVYANNYSGDAAADSRDGHGNINASIIGGYNSRTGAAYEDANGFNYGLGIAPWVLIGDSKVFANGGSGVFNQPANVRLAAAYNAGARISSNSWGYTSGTSYDSDSQLHDQLVRDAVPGAAGNQEMTIVFAAGNDGPGASTVHPPGTAKNIITVGASENVRPTGTDGCGIGNSGADNARDLVSFSSHGPAQDARRKPEICAPGSHIQGAASRATGYDGSGVCNAYWPSGQTLYCWSSGTSHSTPAISGTAALVRQFWVNRGFPAPSPAMVKASLVNGAAYLSGTGANDTLWSNGQGMGRVNLGMVFDDAARVRVDQTQVLGATGATYTVHGSVADAARPFRVTLAWTDAPGPTSGNAYVNNLDLEVTVNGTLYRGNVFSGAASTAGGAADARDNLESVFLPAGAAGSFTVTVRATNIAGDGVPGNADTTDQDFALVVYNGTAGASGPDFSLSAAPASSTVAQGSSATYTVSTSALNGFSSSVSLSASPAIAGVTYAFAPASIAGSGASTFSAATSASTPPGTYDIAILGTSGSLSHTTHVSLSIDARGGPVKTYSVAPSLPIPDNNATGVTSTISVSDSSTIHSISVAVNIAHTFINDLLVTLIAPDDTRFILHNRTGGSAHDILTAYAVATTPYQSLTALAGTGTAGMWKLKVQDLSAHDVGTLNSWAVTFNGESTANPSLPIPDDNATGVTSTMNFAQTGTVSAVRVRVSITHPFIGDLVVTLIGPDNTSVILHNRTGGSSDNILTEYPDLTAPNQSLSAFSGRAIHGAWRLRVQDLAAQDVGTLVSWTLSLSAQ